MKKILMTVCVLLLAGLVVACSSSEADEPDLEDNAIGEYANASQGVNDGSVDLDGARDYIRLMQWSYYNAYPCSAFVMTSVEEAGGYFVLRGYIARNTLSLDELEAIRAETNVELGGIRFIHSAIDIEGFMATDTIYNTQTGADMFLIPAFFGENEGENRRYRIMEADGSTLFYINTGMYREVVVSRTTPVDIYRLVVEQMEWGYLEMFAPLETTAEILLSRNGYDIPETFPYDGTFMLVFEGGSVERLVWRVF